MTGRRNSRASQRKAKLEAAKNLAESPDDDEIDDEEGKEWNEEEGGEDAAAIDQGGKKSKDLSDFPVVDLSKESRRRDKDYPDITVNDDIPYWKIVTNTRTIRVNLKNGVHVFGRTWEGGKNNVLDIHDMKVSREHIQVTVRPMKVTCKNIGRNPIRHYPEGGDEDGVRIDPGDEFHWKHGELLEISWKNRGANPLYLRKTIAGRKYALSVEKRSRQDKARAAASSVAHTKKVVGRKRNGSTKVDKQGTSHEVSKKTSEGAKHEVSDGNPATTSTSSSKNNKADEYVLKLIEDALFSDTPTKKSSSSSNKKNNNQTSGADCKTGKKNDIISEDSSNKEQRETKNSSTNQSSLIQQPFERTGSSQWLISNADGESPLHRGTLHGMGSPGRNALGLSPKMDSPNSPRSPRLWTGPPSAYKKPFSWSSATAGAHPPGGDGGNHHHQQMDEIFGAQRIQSPDLTEMVSNNSEAARTADSFPFGKQNSASSIFASDKHNTSPRTLKRRRPSNEGGGHDDNNNRLKVPNLTAVDMMEGASSTGSTPSSQASESKNDPKKQSAAMEIDRSKSPTGGLSAQQQEEEEQRQQQQQQQQQQQDIIPAGPGPRVGVDFQVDIPNLCQRHKDLSKIAGEGKGSIGAWAKVMQSGPEPLPMDADDTADTTNDWTDEERKAFAKAMYEFPKDFIAISRSVPVLQNKKTPNDIIAYYYRQYKISDDYVRWKASLENGNGEFEDDSDDDEEEGEGKTLEKREDEQQQEDDSSNSKMEVDDDSKQVASAMEEEEEGQEKGKQELGKEDDQEEDLGSRSRRVNYSEEKLEKATVPLVDGGPRSIQPSLSEMFSFFNFETFEGNISVTYQNETYKATLRPDGVIVFQGTEYDSASSFSVTAKRIRNPTLRGDNGWNSVMYKNKSLGEWRDEYTKLKFGGTPNTTSTASARRGSVNSSGGSITSGGQGPTLQRSHSVCSTSLPANYSAFAKGTGAGTPGGAQQSVSLSPWEVVDTGNTGSKRGGGRVGARSQPQRLSGFFNLDIDSSSDEDENKDDIVVDYFNNTIENQSPAAASSGRRSRAGTPVNAGGAGGGGGTGGGIGAGLLDRKSTKKNSISLANLVDSGFLKPGKKVLRVKYKERIFYGDLSEKGIITDCQNGRDYLVPSLWSIELKRSVNPNVRSDSGWYSIFYIPPGVADGAEDEEYQSLHTYRKLLEQHKLSEKEAKMKQRYSIVKDVAQMRGVSESDLPDIANHQYCYGKWLKTRSAAVGRPKRKRGSIDKDYVDDDEEDDDEYVENTVGRRPKKRGGRTGNGTTTRKKKEQIYCICQANGDGDEDEEEAGEDKGFYVQCSKGSGACGGWVHPKCFGFNMSQKDAEKVKEFVCPLCSGDGIELKVSVNEIKDQATVYPVGTLLMCRIDFPRNQPIGWFPAKIVEIDQIHHPDTPYRISFAFDPDLMEWIQLGPNDPTRVLAVDWAKTPCYKEQDILWRQNAMKRGSKNNKN